MEGVRVHMIPTYGLAAVLMAATAVGARRDHRRGRRLVRVGATVSLLGWIAIAAVLPSVFPVFEYERPHGPYGIGTAIYELKPAPKNRELVVQAWYPIGCDVKGTLAHVTTHPTILERAFASFTGLPKPLVDNLRLVRTHAVVNAPLADTGRLPVVLFSHGPLGASRSQSIFQMEALASAGFVVIAIDHTGYASTTISPTVARSRPATPPHGQSSSMSGRRQC